MSKRQIRLSLENLLNQLLDFKGIHCQCIMKTGVTYSGTIGNVDQDNFQVLVARNTFILIPLEDLSEIWLDVPFAY